MKETTAIIIIGLLMVFDLFMVDKRYVNNNPDQFRSAREVDMPFNATEADQRILADTTHFRVFEVEGGMSSARTSFFHKSIGGYHAAKPRRMQQLFDYQIAKNNVRVLNMLNVKYVIQSDENGQKLALQNPAANGNAWFVEKVKFVSSANEEMKALDSLDNKNKVVMNERNYVDYFKGTKFNGEFKKDSLASIQLVAYKPNHLKYVSNNSNEGFAVFSEMYYQNGWKATIDGKETEILNVNYVLRGLKIPAGKHTIEFKFEPEVVKTGSTIALISSIGMLLLIGAGAYFGRNSFFQNGVKIESENYEDYDYLKSRKIIILLAVIHFLFENIIGNYGLLAILPAIINFYIVLWLVKRKILFKFLFKENFTYSLVIYLLILTIRFIVSLIIY